MSIYLGNTKYNKVYLGSTPITKVRYGSNLVFGGSVVIPTVTIGSQVWMAKNVDTAVTGEVYNNDENNRALFGGLYTWDQCATAAAQYPGFNIPSQIE
jgi:hypothetical protein